MTDTAVSSPVTSPHEEACFAYWDNKRDDAINLEPGDDGYFHSHYSVVDFDRTVLDADDDVREERILQEIHRMENRQVELFADTLGALGEHDRVLDVGCGRGGTSLHVHERFGCHVDGVDFSPYRLGIARRSAAAKGYGDRVAFHRANMAATPFPDGHFDVVVDNEAAVQMESQQQLCREIARVLRPGGRYALAIWLAGDAAAQQTPELSAIDANYHTCLPTRAQHLQALLDNGLVPLRIDDLTDQAVPYWELREHSAHATGVEQPFLHTLRNRLMNYLFVVAERQ
jgi:geranyl diphosphate 2-C-methyltransferase